MQVWSRSRNHWESRKSLTHSVGAGGGVRNTSKWTAVRGSKHGTCGLWFLDPIIALQAWKKLHLPIASLIMGVLYVPEQKCDYKDTWCQTNILYRHISQLSYQQYPCPCSLTASYSVANPVTQPCFNPISNSTFWCRTSQDLPEGSPCLCLDPKAEATTGHRCMSKILVTAFNDVDVTTYPTAQLSSPLGSFS